MNAGRLVDRHAMCWLRPLEAPLDAVWPTISTLVGLRRWWVVPPSEFELRVGARFKHHWENTVADFREGEYIDLAEPTGEYAGTGGMRMEVRSAGEATLFMFLDTWGSQVTMNNGDGHEAEQPGGPGTPWSGVAAGWHAMIDRLESVVAGIEPEQAYDELVAFYTGYLNDLYRWNEMVQRRIEA
jgi:uncharacterized protein YndB with AHSA1/START domain